MTLLGYIGYNMTLTENYLQCWFNNDQLADLESYCKRHNVSKYGLMKKAVLDILYPEGPKQSRLHNAAKKINLGGGK